MTGNDGRYFYKYMTRSTVEAVLENTKLRWSSPARLNDPYDLQFNFVANYDAKKLENTLLQRMWLDYSGGVDKNTENYTASMLNLLRKTIPELDPKQFREIFEEEIREEIRSLPKIIETFNAKLDELFENSQVICFSEVMDSVPMWAHYAEKHKGVVLQFCCKSNLDSFFRIARPVQYVEIIPDLFTQKILIDYIYNSGKLLAQEGFYTRMLNKAQDWAYEREWRVLVPLENSEVSGPYGDFPFLKEELCSVIFGLDTPQEDCEKISKIALDSCPHVELQKVQKTERGRGFDVTHFSLEDAG